MSLLEPPVTFLWGLAQPPTGAEADAPLGKWWAQYAAGLGRLTPSALAELTRSSRAIVSLLPNPRSWGNNPTPFKGVVVGSVQSGKTANMIGVAASAIDRGYNLVIVLAGLKDDLRRQTARRFNTQLLKQCDLVVGAVPGQRTMSTPPGAGPLGGYALSYFDDAHQDPDIRRGTLRALERNEPAVLVIKKHRVPIEVVRDLIQDAAARIVGLSVLVLDDECDEASVAREIGDDAVVPDSIAGLWRSTNANTAYVGYTATAAANLLQHRDQPLFPQHFVFLLRYPGAENTRFSFQEPDPDNWYTGGECFYSDFEREDEDDPSFLIEVLTEQGPSDGAPPKSDLRRALLAYFVSGAYRLAVEPSRGFAGGLETPPAHCMLVHTSQGVADHGDWLDAMLGMWGGERLPDRRARFAAAALANDLAQKDDWVATYESFRRSAERVRRERPRAQARRVPPWDEVKARLREVFENVRIRVVNSTAEDGSSLDFQAGTDAAGNLSPPTDIFTIVIGGSRLSRGLTIEGLAINYFARWARVPREDSVLQMARWFGYRGPHLEFCRLFVSEPRLAALREIHENDEHLRSQLRALCDNRGNLNDATIWVRASAGSVPTGKVAGLKEHPTTFSPFCRFLPFVEVGDAAGAAQAWASDLAKKIAASGSKRDVIASGTNVVRGQLLVDCALADVLALLESLPISGHNPEPALQPFPQHFRPPGPGPRVNRLRPVDDPYSIAAFLRWWQSSGAPLPKFNVGISFGSLVDEDELFPFKLVNRFVDSLGAVSGGWTGRSAGWAGDQLFDAHPRGSCLDGTYLRVGGSDALILVYVIHKRASGRSGSGAERSHHVPAIAVSIPAGGPTDTLFVGGGLRPGSV